MSIITFYSLLVYDEISKQLLYTKYNFDFDTYKDDFNILSNDKVQIFTDFWIRNNYIKSKPYIVYDDYKKYFKPITPEIIEYVDKYGCLHKNIAKL